MSRRVGYLRSLMVVVIVLAVSAGMALALEVGQPAPDFTLQSTTGEKISLHQFKGKKHVLIQFYSMDFNPT